MKEETIGKKAELLLHVIPNLYAFTVSIYVYAKGKYNPVAGFVCWIGSPCKESSDADCVSNGGSPDDLVLRIIASAAPVVLVWILSCTFLVVTLCSFQRKPRTIQRDQPSSRQETPTGETAKTKCSLLCSRIKNCLCFTEDEPSGATLLAERLSQASRASVLREKDLRNLVITYIITFTTSNIFPLICCMIYTYSSDPPHFAMIFLARLLFPLQGFFNVLVYAHPHVSSYRRNHSDHNWLQAFWEVVKSGGDSDTLRTGRTRSRRGSLRKQQKVLAQTGNFQRSLFSNSKRSFDELGTSNPNRSLTIQEKRIDFCDQNIDDFGKHAVIIEDESEVGDIEDQMRSFEANTEQEVKEEIF